MVTKEEIVQWEREWRSRLSGCSLVAEADVDPDLAIRAFRVLGRNWLRRETVADRDRLANAYPAILLCGLCAIGSQQYDAGTFWDHVWDELRTARDANRQGELAESFRKGLNQIGLSHFTLPSRRNVGEILLHGGVPLKSISAFTHVLARWDAANPSGDARSFIAWIASQSQQVAVSRGLDVPTWLFLTETGDIAEDFVERCLVAIDQAGGEGGESPALPAPVLDEIADALAGTGSPSVHDRARRLVDAVPVLVYSAHHGVQVRLPPLEVVTEADVEWSVTIDGTRVHVESPAPWPGDPVEPKFVSVRSPVQRTIVSVTPSDQLWELDLVDLAEPLLVFDASSKRLIPARNSLPRGKVWAVTPNEQGAPLTEVFEADGSNVVVEEAPTPYGWEGWAFASIDLSDVTRLRRRGTERWRYVSTIRRPRLLDQAHVPFVETRDGRAVLTDAPNIEVPGTGAEGSIVWQVAISSADGTPVAAHDFEVGELAAEVDPWVDVSRPILGDFVVTVRGPLGRGATHRVAVAEGFTATASTPFRWMRADGRGLESAALSINSGEFVRADLAISFESRRWRRAANLRTTAGALEITARLPSMAVSTTGKATRSRSGGPIPLDLETLEGTTLHVVVPPGTPGTRLAAVANGELVQAIPGFQRGDDRMFELAQLCDTLARHRFAQLRLILDDHSIPVAYVRPSQLASGATVDENGVLTLADAHPVEGLTALVYPKHAPWRGPTRIAFTTGETTVALPEELIREGAATFVLSVDNPWVPIETPPLPDWSTRNAFIAEWSQPVEPEDPKEHGFRSWLAGSASCPASSDSLPIALKIYTLVPEFARGLDVDRLRTDLADAVRSNRAQVVEAVLHSHAGALDLFRLFVEADVVSVPREEWRSSELLWSFSPALGVVADTDEHKGPNREQFRDNLRKYVGDSALEILDDGIDQFAAAGRFGDSHRRIENMPQERIDALWAAASVLPKNLLDRDTRDQASKHLFDHRRDRSLDAVIAVSRTLIVEARTALEVDLGNFAWAPIDAQSSDGGWMNLPMLSLACAFVARAASRGGSQSLRAHEKLRKAYMRLADAAPEIVQQDLALAELWITRWNEK